MNNIEKLNYQQILDKIKEKTDEVSEFAYDNIDYQELGLGEVEEIDQYGGEGQGDTWYSVKYFKNHDVYIKINGWYQSHNGTDFNGWEDCEEVRPKEKVITVYE